MNLEALSPSLITAIVSLSISLMTLYQFFNNKSFQEEQFVKSNNRAFTSKLYDLRLEHYPNAFHILDELYKEKGGTINPTIAKSCCENLIKWKTGIIHLIISNEARSSFFTLRDILMKNPAHQDRYSPEQVEKITFAIKDFRRQLRRDVGFMFREEKERRSN
ncbi:hypothetical protein [Chryseobacterium camelliae]|uniref:hypothetical protein n=1 Tax=Chryseobacterium camelliae TaxID=1265445 RepID=UPI002855482F|nr:hypothetical protein [Chryseobacterium camelliae]MDR6513777.1 hypothetical protein [Chryseobacterium camelliae]